MIDIPGCCTCGEIIPEGRQVCPKCEKQYGKRNTYYNGSGCSDPTAHEAINNIRREKEVNRLIKILKHKISENGFTLLNRIELKDKESGIIFK